MPSRQRKWICLALATMATGCIRFRNDAPSGADAAPLNDAGSSTDSEIDTGVSAEGGDAVVILPPVCERFSPTIAESIAGDLISELLSDCSLRRYFATLPPIRVTHLQECLTAQIGQVMGCRHPDGEPFRYPVVDSKGQFCRDMKGSHMGFSTSDGDFDAFIADLGDALRQNGLNGDEIMRVAAVFGATRGDIVRLKDAGPTAPCDAPDAS